MSSGARNWSDNIAFALSARRAIAQDITLVIPTLGRPVLEQCLGALLDGTLWPGAVIIVDQGSNETIRDWLADLERLEIRSRYQPCSGRGRALGLNAGLRLVETPFVVITDDDCLPQARWIEGFASAFENYPGMAITGRVEAAGEERVISTVSDPSPSIATRPRIDYDRLSGGNCGMGMDVLRTVGLFDDDARLRYAEDGEWAYRALRADVPIVYAPELVVAHIGWRDRVERLSQYRDYAHSHGAFFGKHLRRGDLFMLPRAGMHFARAALRWLRGTLRGDAELASNGRSYVTQLLPGMATGFASKQKAPSLE